MKKEMYLKKVEELKGDLKTAEKALVQLSKDYIESSKPCNTEDTVNIVLQSGRKVSGVVKTFGILVDKNVHVTSYKDGNTMKYITAPNQLVTVK